MGKTGGGNTALDEVAHLVHKNSERTLDPVIDTGQKAGTSSTASESPVFSTGSPGLIPEVSS